tara:strand:- start:124 stop:357 length:234 start_codon:yes stop_codon:yes gene_type:complete
MKKISKVLLFTSMLSCDSKPIVVSKKDVVTNITISNSSGPLKNQILLESINRDKVFIRAINEIKSSNLIIEEFETKM